MNDQYRQAKQTFVSNCTGTALFENSLHIISTTFLTNVLTSNLPSFYAHTLLSIATIIQILNFRSIPLLLVFSAFLIRTPLKFNDFRNSIRIFRRSLLTFTSIVIFAVDFPSCPRRLAKTETAGPLLGLMDFGVGTFTFLKGLCHSQRPYTLAQSLKRNRMMLVLGIAKPLVCHLVNYQVHESEYGLHWNYFLTLFVVSVFLDLGNPVLNILLNTLLPTRFLIRFLGLFGYFGRSNAIGVVGTLGHLQLASVGVLLNELFKDEIRFSRTLALTLGSLASCQICTRLGLAYDRAKCNLAYQLAVIYAASLSLLVSRIRSSPSPTPNPIDRSGLLYFLISNILTGIGNIVIDTLRIQSRSQTLAILATYQITTFLLVTILQSD